MGKENIKLYEGINNLILYKKDNGGRWYKVDDLNWEDGGDLIRAFFEIRDYDNLKPLRETKRTKFYFIDKRYF